MELNLTSESSQGFFGFGQVEDILKLIKGDNQGFTLFNLNDEVKQPIDGVRLQFETGIQSYRQLASRRFD